MNKSANVLFITSISPFPMRGGEQLRSYALLKMLSNTGMNVTAIIDESTNIPKIPNVRFIEFAYKKYQSDIHLVNIIGIFRRKPQLTKLILDLVSSQNFDIAIIDYHFYGQYIGLFKRAGIKVIYGTHNAQAKLYFQRKATGVKDLIYLVFEYIVQSIHERYFFTKADALLIVSLEDFHFYAGFIKPEKIVLIPNLIEKPSAAMHSSVKENYVIMTANFLAFQNEIGIEWFLKEVWNEELSRRTKLRLYGIGSKKVFESLKNQLQPVNVEAMGEVENIKPFLAKARAAIVPLLNGSGTRLKCLEAMSLKTQLISTSKGSEGIEHGGSVIIADTANDFRNRILDVLDNKIDTVEEAYRIFEEKYSFEPNQDTLSKLIINLTS